jgi:hypothetical protein
MGRSFLGRIATGSILWKSGAAGGQHGEGTFRKSFFLPQSKQRNAELAPLGADFLNNFLCVLCGERLLGSLSVGFLTTPAAVQTMTEQVLECRGDVL